MVAGYIEPHLRAETSALVSGLESVPSKEVEYKSVGLKEFNFEKTIERKPRLVLIDELAHTNAQGMRHEKRWQDILEVLENGIDVYTTVNVQHIESLNDKVASITGITFPIVFLIMLMKLNWWMLKSMNFWKDSAREKSIVRKELLPP